MNRYLTGRVRGRITAFLLAAVLLPATYAATPAPAAKGRLVKHGIVVDFEARALNGPSDTLIEGQMAEVRFRLTEEATGAPVRGITPGVWMDIGEVIQGQPGAEQKSCKDKIALYLKGVVGIRPMVDLNSYYIVVMNQEASLSVIDPLVSMAGVTSTLGQISLSGVATDWVVAEDQKQLFVSIPETGLVAVVDTDTFKVITDIDAGEQPTRVLLQPDGRYLWVGNDATGESGSGVTIIDTQTLAAVKHIATGAGHHEIAFTSDSKTAFVSNRTAGTVSVIDVATLIKVKDIATGPLPISLAYSALSEALYVADGRAGTVTIVDGQALEVQQRIMLQPGLGPLRFAPGGRYALTVNPTRNQVNVIDATSNKQVQTIDVSGKPFQISFSNAFAYVRALASERVTMINLTSLGEGKKPIVQGFDAGIGAPQLAGNLPLAESTAFTTSEAAVFIVNPVDNTTYFYMEGMNAASGNYRVFGASARAVTIIDRSLKEEQPGVYTSTVKIPAAGRYDVAFMLETPQMLHCFTADASEDPDLEKTFAALSIEYLQESHRVPSNSTVALRFRLSDPATGEPQSGINGVSVLYFRTPGADRTVLAAVDQGNGVYKALLPIGRPGGYYVYVGVPSQRIGYDTLPFFTLAAIPHEDSK